MTEGGSTNAWIVTHDGRLVTRQTDNHILAGVTAIKSLKLAQRLADIPGVYLPQKILRRMEQADRSGNAAEEGAQIALEIVNRIKEYRGQGIHGIHIMPIGWHEIVPRLVRESGLTS